jgi:hypothetical protein
MRFHYIKSCLNNLFNISFLLIEYPLFSLNEGSSSSGKSIALRLSVNLIRSAVSVFYTLVGVFGDLLSTEGKQGIALQFIKIIFFKFSKMCKQ